MIGIAIVLWLAGQPTTAQVESLRLSSPTYLTVESAREHLMAARQVHSLYPQVRTSLLLGIAWHESRFQSNAVSHEGATRVSCGVMTPEPTNKCVSAPLVAQYTAGAQHLVVWLDACHGNEHCALTGYARGFYLINACRAGPVWRTRNSVQDDLCKTADYFQSLAKYFKEAAGEL